jgi:hypothetical protein
LSTSFDRRHHRPTLAALILSLVSACATHVPVPAGTRCEVANFIVDDAFEGARRGTCAPLDANRVRLEIVPDDDNVSNPSPWYAFRVLPKKRTTAEIVLDYGDWPHRYRPKISADGRNWHALQDHSVTVSEDGSKATLRVALPDRPLWIAAQELVTPQHVSEWSRALADRSDAELSTPGHSKAGRPIPMLETTTKASDLILLVGRQHPPEVSGAVAMAAFVETLFADTALAKSFRRHYGIVAIPLLNPDGVSHGHWRHNLGGVDLNRDWGPFTQPETQLIPELLDKLDENQRRIRIFIDFHSTNRNLFYTQPGEDPTDPPGFVPRWFERVRPRLPHYPFSDEQRLQSDTPNGKNYMYKRYGIPSVTYEVGDEMDRRVTADAARIFAEELMRLLLEDVAAPVALGRAQRSSGQGSARDLQATPTSPSRRGSAAPVHVSDSYASACTPPK